MDLSLSDEQRLLKDSVSRFARDHYSVELRRSLRDTKEGFKPEHWQQFAELGWLSLPFAKDDGGLDGSALDTAVIMEELGRTLIIEPYLVNVVICGGFLRRADEALRRVCLPPLMAGESQWAFAFSEQGGRYNLNDVTVAAKADGGDFMLSGEKIAVVNGHIADQLLVTARLSGKRRDRQGVGLFLVDGNDSGITRRSYPLVDGYRGANICFEKASAQVLALHAMPLLEIVIAEAMSAMGAEALGAMEALLHTTVAYSKTREQFGQPIGKFQALQHRMADMYLQCEGLRSLLYYTVIAQIEQREDAIKAASGLKVKMGDAGRFVSQQAIQLHGGIGMTDELSVGHYFKRLLLLNTLFGDAEYHVKRYAALS